MNFLAWLLKRMKRKIFGGEWGWLYKYRRTIQEEMPIALVATFFCGILWTLVLGIAAVYFILPDRETVDIVVKIIWMCPILFFLYNWIYSLYELYDTERMATWDRLKE